MARWRQMIGFGALAVCLVTALNIGRILWISSHQPAPPVPTKPIICFTFIEAWGAETTCQSVVRGHLADGAVGFRVYVVNPSPALR